MGLGDLAQVTQRQHGLFTRGQARAAGIDRNRLRRLVHRGEISTVTSRVFRVNGGGPSPYATSMAAVLDAGPDAVASHITAASLWGVPNLPQRPLHVTVPRTTRLRADTLAKVHQATELPPDLMAVHHDVPVAAPALVVLQVAAQAPRRAAHVCDTLWSMRILTIAEVADVHERFSRQGRDGIRLVRRLLEGRSDDMRPAESGNERRFEKIMWDAGIRTLRRQVDVGAGSWIGRVDYLDSVVPLVVEVHSDRYHTSHTAREADAVRIAALEAAGFTVVVVWDHEIWGDPKSVIERVRKARATLL